ncbi:hypothetical protein I4F81_005147 [Pyropia yezoensis]|uniref:Uncharacterized protein n=1 Tax=Pyropia yezoensis TaxID=2788 RepID=A0ACC3BWZ8_PYRYE|nr:hypothetical protein I4F81_005147 [Neopyropia yezoensis]
MEEVSVQLAQFRHGVEHVLLPDIVNVTKLAHQRHRDGVGFAHESVEHGVGVHTELVEDVQPEQQRHVHVHDVHHQLHEEVVGQRDAHSQRANTGVPASAKAVHLGHLVPLESSWQSRPVQVRVGLRLADDGALCASVDARPLEVFHRLQQSQEARVLFDTRGSTPPSVCEGKSTTPALYAKSDSSLCTPSSSLAAGSESCTRVSKMSTSFCAAPPASSLSSALSPSSSSPVTPAASSCEHSWYKTALAAGCVARFLA